MRRGNPLIKQHASEGGNKLLELYGKDYFSKLGKKGRAKQLARVEIHESK